MKHLKLFKTQAEFDEATWELPNVSYVVENDTVYYHPLAAIDYNSQYLTFEAIEDSTFSLMHTENVCQYSMDDCKTWIELPNNTETPTINAGSKIYFKMTDPIIMNPYENGNGYMGIGIFSSTGKFNISGNIMSLLYGDDFEDKKNLTGKVFIGLFGMCENLVSAENLILPATTLAESCYTAMFAACTSLTTAPELPATTLADGCYNYMFQDCSSLTTAPELSATILARNCYNGMFYYCSSLTIAPELPATTLADGCYNDMFKCCSKLTTAPSILPATTLASDCYKGMFRACDLLTTAPELPATTLADKCYYYMFEGCSSLNYIKMLATDISASDSLSNWVIGVSENGTFVKHPNMTSLPTDTNGIPEGWTVVDYQ